MKDERFYYRPVLVGINNPWSKLPEDVLAPKKDKPNCSGSRLLKIIKSRLPSYTAENYLRDFPCRINLEDVGRNIFKQYKTPRTFIVFGKDTLSVIIGDRLEADRLTLGLNEKPPSFGLTEKSGSCLYLVPHPSGLNRWYNDKSNVVATGSFLLNMSRLHGKLV